MSSAKETSVEQELQEKDRIIAKLEQDLRWANQEVGRYIGLAQEAHQHRALTIEAAVSKILNSPIEELEQFVFGHDVLPSKDTSKDAILGMLRRKRLEINARLVETQHAFEEQMMQDLANIQGAQEDPKECDVGKLLVQLQEQMHKDQSEGWHFFYSLHDDDEYIHMYRVHESGCWGPYFDDPTGVDQLPHVSRVLINRFRQYGSSNVYQHLSDLATYHYMWFSGIQLNRVTDYESWAELDVEPYEKRFEKAKQGQLEE